MTCVRSPPTRPLDLQVCGFNICVRHESLLAQVAGVVNLLAQSRAPAFAAPVLRRSQSPMVTLKGGLDPSHIAVGELLQRLLASLGWEEARSTFWPA